MALYLVRRLIGGKNDSFHPRVLASRLVARGRMLARTTVFNPDQPDTIASDEAGLRPLGSTLM